MYVVSAIQDTVLETTIKVKFKAQKCVYYRKMLVAVYLTTVAGRTAAKRQLRSDMKVEFCNNKQHSLLTVTEVRMFLNYLTTALP